MTVRSFEDRVEAIIRNNGLFRAGQRVGVAVSGGADSVCLLHVLNTFGPGLGISLCVVHLDHQLRPESGADAEFVAQLAARLGLPLQLHREDVRVYDSNLEQAGRLARRTFFRKLIGSGVADVIALAHTLSDQAETVLLRLIRGSGGTGLGGMHAMTGHFVRPLLEITRPDVEAYLKEQKLVWREDPTNAEPSFLRNRIRHELLPLLTNAYNPQIQRLLGHTALLNQDDEDYFASELDRLSPESLTALQDGTVLIRCEALTSLPTALGRRLLRRAIEAVRGDLRSIDFMHIERVLEMARATQGSDRAQIPGVDCFRSFDWLRLALPGRDSADRRDYSMEVTAPGEFEIPGQSERILLEVLDSRGFPADRGYNESINDLDLSKTTSRLQLRNWRPGDRYLRQGSKSPEKIKELFQTFRIPLWERRNWPVLTQGGSIVWTRRFGPASEFAAGNESVLILRIREQRACH